MADVETIFDKFSSLVKTLDYRDVFRIQSSIEDAVFCEVSSRIWVVNYFLYKFYLRFLTRFWMHFQVMCWICLKGTISIARWRHHVSQLLMINAFNVLIFGSIALVMHSAFGVFVCLNICMFETFANLLLTKGYFKNFKWFLKNHRSYINTFFQKAREAFLEIV